MPLPAPAVLGVTPGGSGCDTVVPGAGRGCPARSRQTAGGVDGGRQTAGGAGFTTLVKVGNRAPPPAPPPPPISGPSSRPGRCNPFGPASDILSMDSIRRRISLILISLACSFLFALVSATKQ